MYKGVCNQNGYVLNIRLPLESFEYEGWNARVGCDYDVNGADDGRSVEIFLSKTLVLIIECVRNDAILELCDGCGEWLCGTHARCLH